MTEPKKPSGYRLAIVNPQTLVGTEIQSILRERNFPFAKVVLLDSTGTSTGLLTEIGDEPAIVLPVSDDEMEDCDIVFFCGSAENNREWIERYRDDNFIAIDLSQPSSADGKLVIAGLNLDEIDTSDRLLVSPHPIAIPIALILHQIERLGRVESCTASVVQPASESGPLGVEELARQTINVLNIQTVPQEVFGRQLAFNLYPAPERNEEFITSQIRALTDPATELALLVTQGGMFHSHTFSLFIRTEDDLSVDRITASLQENAAIALAEGDQAFGTIDAAGKDEVLIAEVRPDPSIPGGFWVWAVCDNLRRGSALNAVLIAEKMLFGSGVN
ncbi:MAG: aspartate-semialdehyde dehydrogenase [Thermoanaerobaculia bacterium]|jgi:aspartate-semialdehyde dehydrogenase|nr:aspartate-semialdehyde dehydrogenase [Thermoanaerobaculia bacterium]